LSETGTIARIRTNAAALETAVAGAPPFKHRNAFRLFLAAEARRMSGQENPVVCGLALRECLTSVAETAPDPRVAAWSRDLLNTDLMALGHEALLPVRASAARIGLDNGLKLTGAVVLALAVLIGAGRIYTLRISQLGSLVYVHDTLTRTTFVCSEGACTSDPAQVGVR
jgi:hypothetical protein